MISLHMPNYVQNTIIDFKSCNTIVYARLYRGKKRIKEHVESPSKLKILQKENGLSKYPTVVLLKRYILEYQHHSSHGQMYL